MAQLLGLAILTGPSRWGVAHGKQLTKATATDHQQRERGAELPAAPQKPAARKHAVARLMAAAYPGSVSRRAGQSSC